MGADAPGGSEQVIAIFDGEMNLVRAPTRVRDLNPIITRQATENRYRDVDIDYAAFHFANPLPHSFEIAPSHFGGQPTYVLGYPDPTGTGDYDDAAHRPRWNGRDAVGNLVQMYSRGFVIDLLTLVTVYKKALFDSPTSPRPTMNVFSMIADAAPGMSGGPVINQNGHVLGVESAIATYLGDKGDVVVSSIVFGVRPPMWDDKSRR